MPGTHAGGIKAAKANLMKDPNFYAKIGKKGGSVFTDKAKGFAANPTLAKRAGRLGGSKTKRGFKWLGDVDEKRGRFVNKVTGEEVISEYAKSIMK